MTLCMVELPVAAQRGARKKVPTQEASGLRADRIRHRCAALTKRFGGPFSCIPRRLMLGLGVQFGADEDDHGRQLEPRHESNHRAQ